MNPIRFPGANTDYHKPRNWNDAVDGECGVLPVCVKGSQFTSVWQPTAAERQRIANGENITLTIVGVQAPVMLGVARIEGEELRFTGLERLVEKATIVAENPNGHNATVLAHAVLREFTNGK